MLNTMRHRSDLLEDAESTEEERRWLLALTDMDNHNHISKSYL